MSSVSPFPTVICGHGESSTSAYGQLAAPSCKPSRSDEPNLQPCIPNSPGFSRVRVCHGEATGRGEVREKCKGKRTWAWEAWQKQKEVFWSNPCCWWLFLLVGCLFLLVGCLFLCFVRSFVLFVPLFCLFVCLFCLFVCGSDLNRPNHQDVLISSAVRAGLDSMAENCHENISNSPPRKFNVDTKNDVFFFLNMYLLANMAILGSKR